VKNVTGYDMAKLYCGAFGTLGVITSAWLRLHPQPSRVRTLEAELPASAESFNLCRRLSKQMSVRAFVWEEAAIAEGLAKVVIEWGGSVEGVDYDHAETEAAFAKSSGGAAQSSLNVRDEDRSVVDQLRDARATRGGDEEVVLRARVLGTSAFDLTRSMREAGLAVSVDLGLGAIQARGALGAPEALLALRHQAENGSGHLFCESMPGSWRGEVDAFGASAETAPLMAILKQRFDPALILNPGRFVVGD
jgi:glycolate oxidase FAD binding subunit